jgi:Fe2+ or Zn2+ uptake regulation protein
MAAKPRATRRRTTRQLALVLAAVRAAGTEHPTAEEVCRRVRRVLPRVSLGTVYRNLQRLVGEGLVGVAHLGARVARYDPTPAAHDHFVCRSCGRVEDLLAGPSVAGVRSLKRAGHEVTAHALVLYGRCRDCRRGR